jgi:hypothetical protein
MLTDTRRSSGERLIRIIFKECQMVGRSNCFVIGSATGDWELGNVGWHQILSPVSEI